MSFSGRLGNTLCRILNVDSSKSKNFLTAIQRPRTNMERVEMSTSMDIKYLHKENERHAQAISDMKSKFKLAFQSLVDSDDIEEEGDKKPAATEIVDESAATNGTKSTKKRTSKDASEGGGKRKSKKML